MSRYYPVAFLSLIISCIRFIRHVLGLEAEECVYGLRNVCTGWEAEVFCRDELTQLVS